MTYKFKRIIFWISLIGLLVFELANVYFIMPMPGSQQHDSLPFAYFLYTNRWWFRGLFVAGLLLGGFSARFAKKWIPMLGIVPVGILLYVLNFQIAADKMFRQVKTFTMANAAQNNIDSNRLVIGISIGNEARAYPIRLIGYHHFVEDSIQGKPILVTYCTVCRTGRVFSPMVDGVKQQFRLVGMDHFNAMIEDKATKSWWQQATGVAVAGPLKGKSLKEITCTQTTLAEWLKMNPHSLVMQPDPAFEKSYDTSLNYEAGLSRKKLTGTDSISWKDKSWVVGIQMNGTARAYDWNLLKSKQLITDTLAGKPLALILATDGKSFYALDITGVGMPVNLSGDTLYTASGKYLANGRSVEGGPNLPQVQAYQEFWHSWMRFRVRTERFGE